MNRTAHYIDQLVALLKFSGLWLYTNDLCNINFYTPILRLGYMWSIFVANGVSVYQIGLKESLKDIAIYIPVMVLINVQTLTVLIKNEQMKNLLNLLKICFTPYTEHWQFDLLEKANNFGWIIVRVYKGVMLFFYIFYFLLPTSADIIIYFLDYDTDTTYSLPSPLTGYLDKHPARSLKNCIVLSLAFLWVTINFLSNVGVMCSFFIIILYSHTILKIFNMYGDRLDFSSTKTMRSSIIELIHMHQNILKLSQGLKDFYGFIFSFQNLLTSVCLCLCLFTASTNKDKAIVLSYGFGVIYYISLSFMCNLLGQFIQSESENVIVSISNIPWIHMKAALRRDVNLILLQGKREIVISYKGRSPLNLRTFMSILNTSYSYFMLLRSVA
uniref:Odorant receptor n=1 Tax=Rhodnius prolixus TaxID=13249 RepID=T1HB84_RHOPR